MSVDKIVDGINPEDDPIDRRILYELSGARLNEEDFHSDSSADEDEDEGDGGDSEFTIGARGRFTTFKELSHRADTVGSRESLL